MKYAKLINNSPAFAPNPILVDNNWIGNPPGEIYYEEGYKPVIYNDYPGDAGEGYEWVEKWVETDYSIQRKWEKIEVPISEQEALTKYINELTGKNDTNLEEASESLIHIVKEVK